MSSTGSPIPLTAGTPVAVPGEPTGQPTIAVTLANLSSFALSVQMGNSVEYVPPWTEQTFTKGLTGPLPVITPELLPGAPSAGTASVLVTYWWPDDAVPPEAPVTLVAAAIAAAISGVVQVVTSPGTSLNVTGTLDANITNATLNVATAANVIFTAADTAPLVTNVEIPGIVVGAGLTAYYQVDGAGGTVAADYLLVLLRSGANLTEVQYLQFALQFLLATDAQGNIANLGMENYVQTFVAPVEYDPGQYYQVAYLVPLGGLTWIGGTIGFALKNTGASGFSDNVYLSVIAHLDTVPVAVPGGIVINSGTVSIGNTPSVTISGTPAVTITSGSVTIASGTVTVSTSPTTPLNITGPVDANITNASITVAGSVSISGTPAVTISGTPAVTITSGSVTIASGTVTVQTAAGAPISITGSVTISGTSTVTISGTPTVNIAAGQVIQVENVAGGSVTIAGTVNIGNTPAVSISGTPTVTITSGSVDIGSGNITIVGGQGGINVSTEVVPQLLGTISVPAGQKGGAIMLSPPPAGVTAITVIVIGSAASSLIVDSVAAIGQTSGWDWIIGAPLESLALSGSAAYTGLVPGAAEDVQVSVNTVDAPVAATAIALVVGWYGNAVVQPVNNLQQPLYVQGPAALAQNQAAGNTARDVMVQGVLASGSPREIADVVTQEAPPQIQAPINVALAAGAAYTLVAAVVGETVRPRKVWIYSSASQQLVLRTAASGGIVLWVGGIVSGIFDLDFEACTTLGAGNALVLQNVGAGTTDVAGHFTAEQF